MLKPMTLPKYRLRRLETTIKEAYSYAKPVCVDTTFRSKGYDNSEGKVHTIKHISDYYYGYSNGKLISISICLGHPESK